MTLRDMIIGVCLFLVLIRMEFSVCFVIFQRICFFLFYCLFEFLFLSFSFDLGYTVTVFASCHFWFFYCFYVVGHRSLFGLGWFVIWALDLYETFLTTQVTFGFRPSTVTFNEFSSGISISYSSSSMSW